MILNGQVRTGLRGRGPDRGPPRRPTHAAQPRAAARARGLYARAARVFTQSRWNGHERRPWLGAEKYVSKEWSETGLNALLGLFREASGRERPADGRFERPVVGSRGLRAEPDAGSFATQKKNRKSDNRARSSRGGTITSRFLESARLPRVPTSLCPNFSKEFRAPFRVSFSRSSRLGLARVARAR